MTTATLSVRESTLVLLQNESIALAILLSLCFTAREAPALEPDVEDEGAAEESAESGKCDIDGDRVVVEERVVEGVDQGLAQVEDATEGNDGAVPADTENGRLASLRLRQRGLFLERVGLRIHTTKRGKSKYLGGVITAKMGKSGLGSWLLVIVESPLTTLQSSRAGGGGQRARR